MAFSTVMVMVRFRSSENWDFFHLAGAEPNIIDGREMAVLIDRFFDFEHTKSIEGTILYKTMERDMRKTFGIFGFTVLLLTYLAPGAISAEGEGSLAGPYNHILMRSMLEKGHGDEIQVREILFAPGWKAPRHYHNSDLFIYVISGEFEVDMEGDVLTTYRAGEVLRMKPNTPMDARNPNDENPLKLAVFQVGKPDAPFVVPIGPEH
jgi:quercetin dioxygenase-like cupin family protein